MRYCKMRMAVLPLLALFIVGGVTACVSAEKVQGAFESMERKFERENAKLLAKDGERRFSKSYTQVFDAAIRAAERLEFEVTDTDRENGVILVEYLVTEDDLQGEILEVARAEVESHMRRELGKPVKVRFEARENVIKGRLVVDEMEEGTKVKIERVWEEKIGETEAPELGYGEHASASKVNVVFPIALESYLIEYWKMIDLELDSEHAGEGDKKPMSEWVVPQG